LTIKHYILTLKKNNRLYTIQNNIPQGNYMQKSFVFSIALINTILFSSMFGMLATKQIKKLSISQRSLTTIKPYLNQLEPNVSLQSPRQILHKIDQFWKKDEKINSHHLLFVNNPQQYAENTRELQSLLIDALVASHFLHEVMQPLSGKENHEIRHGNFHRFVDKWDGVTAEDILYREPHALNSAANKSQIFAAMNTGNKEEMQRIQDDLNREIFILHASYVYQQTRLDRHDFKFVELFHKQENNLRD
jgi:hypothetical protein